MTMSPRFDKFESPRDHVAVEPVANASECRDYTSKCKDWFFGVPGILCGAILGIIIGVLIQKGDPSEVAVTWIGTPGRLFIRAVKCLVTPLVFCSLVVGMADMVALGRAGSVGWRSVMFYTATTIIASTEGLLWVLLMRPYFGDRKKAAADTAAEMAFQCQEEGYFLSNVNGTISCMYDASYNATSTFSASSKFIATDINGVFATASTGFTKRSLTDALQGQLDSAVPSNITTAFSEANLLSIIMFSIPFGVAIAILPRDARVVADFFREIMNVFMTMIKWVIKCTPIAIISLLASSISEQEDLGVLVNDVGIFCLCDIVALFCHMYIFFPVFMRAFIKINPYKWLAKMFRAQLFAFGCASSMATLPITIDCIDATREVSKTLTRFICSLGATIQMDGAAIGYPIAIVFMAETEGIGYIIGNVEYFLVILVSTIGAIGSGPVPSAGIVMTMTIWTSVFPNVPLPSTFAYIVATDWFLDRFQTVVNVTGDTVVARIIADMADMHFEDERENLVLALDRMSNRNSEIKSAVERSSVA